MASEDWRLWITYNGEIYNYRELRSELGAQTLWRSHSDTEVLIKAYEKWQETCLPKLRGMFAFAIWDGRSRELFLARDAFGIKPLYYYQDENVFLFASEVRALLASGLVPRKLSKEGVISYLSFGSTADPLTIVD